jgi:hypothetical protein
MACGWYGRLNPSRLPPGQSHKGKPMNNLSTGDNADITSLIGTLELGDTPRIDDSALLRAGETVMLQPQPLLTMPRALGGSC